MLLVWWSLRTVSSSPCFQSLGPVVYKALYWFFWLRSSFLWNVASFNRANVKKAIVALKDEKCFHALHASVPGNSVESLFIFLPSCCCCCCCYCCCCCCCHLLFLLLLFSYLRLEKKSWQVQINFLLPVFVLLCERANLFSWKSLQHWTLILLELPFWHGIFTDSLCDEFWRLHLFQVVGWSYVYLWLCL